MVKICVISHSELDLSTKSVELMFVPHLKNFSQGDISTYIWMDGQTTQKYKVSPRLLLAHRNRNALDETCSSCTHMTAPEELGVLD